MPARDRSAAILTRNARILAASDICHICGEPGPISRRHRATAPLDDMSTAFYIHAFNELEAQRARLAGAAGQPGAERTRRAGATAALSRYISWYLFGVSYYMTPEQVALHLGDKVRGGRRRRSAQ